MQDPLEITPITRALESSVELPGSKSITNRALILAAMAKGKTKLKGALFSRDTRIMLTALDKLGYSVSANAAAAEIIVLNESGEIPVPCAELNVGNAGTAARFLTAFLARQPGGRYKLDGDPAMRERPMTGLLHALSELGAAEFEFHGEEGHFPFTLNARGYTGGSVAVDASASSQILSALLLAGATYDSGLELLCPDVRPAYVQITLKMREAFGAAPIHVEDSGRYRTEPIDYTSPEIYTIEPDVSAASYFLALALIQGGTLRIPNLGPDPLQGDAHFIEVLAHHGLRVEAKRNEWTATRPPGVDILRGHREIDFNAFSDTFLTYAAIAPLLGGSVRITGIGHTRHQETDRIAGMAAELSKLGQLVKEEDDAITIQAKPNELLARALNARNSGKLLSIETYEDHRFAMSFGILASFDLLGDGKPWLAIKDPNCCGKTFPDFFGVLEKIRHG
ncbi:MAG: 3-phosphoshikimate 1-carboxyvinyltransferase [Opitutales bacterium]